RRRPGRRGAVLRRRQGGDVLRAASEGELLRADGHRPEGMLLVPHGGSGPGSTVTGGELPVAVIGAGPVGLAAAAHLLERGLRPVILEAASEVAASVRDWGHVRLFSPW